MIQEHRVNRLTHRIVSAKGERNIGDAPRDERVRQLTANLSGSLDVVRTIAVVGLNAGCYGEDIRIENDVLCRKVRLLG